MMVALPAYGTTAGEIARAAIVGAGFLAVFAIAEAWRHFGSPPAEWTRKLVHFGGGLLATAFPWLFASHWTVLALGTVFFLILWGTRRLGTLRSVHGVERQSQGGLYYPAAVYILFLIGARTPAFYLVSILALVVSDTAAAVLGSTYGRTQYEVELERRSVEGSAVFFLSTFLVVHLPLLLMTELPRATTVVIAMQLAILVTLLEGISIRGNDNLLVPLASYYLLIKLTDKTLGFLLYQLGAQIAVIALVGLVAWRVQFVTSSGAMALMLFMYGAFGLGGEEWTVAPAIGILAFCAFYRLRCRPTRRASARFQVVATFYVAIVPALAFLANNSFETLITGVPALRSGDPLYPVFVGAVAAQIAIMVYALDPVVRRRGSSLAMSAAAGLAAFLIVVPIGLLAGSRAISATDVLITAAIVAVSSVLYHVVRRRSRLWETAVWNVRLQAMSVAAAAILTLPLTFP